MAKKVLKKKTATKAKSKPKAVTTLLSIATDMNSILGLVLGLKASVQEIAEHIGLTQKLPMSDSIKKDVEAKEQVLQS